MKKLGIDKWLSGSHFPFQFCGYVDWKKANLKVVSKGFSHCFTLDSSLGNGLSDCSGELLQSLLSMGDIIYKKKDIHVCKQSSKYLCFTRRNTLQV